MWVPWFSPHFTNPKFSNCLLEKLAVTEFWFWKSHKTRNAWRVCHLQSAKKCRLHSRDRYINLRWQTFGSIYSPLEGQKAVSPYLKSKLLLPFKPSFAKAFLWFLVCCESTCIRHIWFRETSRRQTVGYVVMPHFFTLFLNLFFYFC